MFEFDVQTYGPTLAEWIRSDDLPPLGPGVSDSQHHQALRQLDMQAAIPVPVTNPDMAQCCLSGIWLMHHFLDESHEISQTINSTTGSYWHALMHRREPDYPNSKYWFRRVAEHPVFPSLCEEARRISEESNLGGRTEYLLEQNSWDPFRFVDLCERYYLAEDRYEQLVQRISLVEWQLLFDYCYQRAVA